MLPGKTYSPEDIGRILIHRAWLIVLTLGLGAVTAFGVSKQLPNRYKSETLIMLVPQRVPETYVKATVSAKIEDRLVTLSDQILSRSHLERIISDLDLYSALRRTLPIEVVVARMREDIGIKIEGKESFRVAFTSRDAVTAQKTTERLASLFIEESTRDRETLAENTNQFLEAQLADARRRLIEHEKKLEAYRSQYSGELPSQAAANLQAIQNLQVQLQNLADATDRARERRLLLERQILDLQSDLTLAPAAPSATSSDARPAESTAQQLQAAEARLRLLLTQYKPDHPDVRSMQRTIRDLEAKLDIEDRRPADSPAPDKAVLPSERLRQQRVRELKVQMDDIDRQLLERQEQERRLRASVSDYQAKLDAVPKRESDLVELTRDYTTLQSTYQSLLAKQEDSKLAANLERKNIGEQFKVLDPARAPERPFSPNRLLIDLGGAAGGLAFGLLLVAFLEYRESSFKSEADVVRLCELPVLALVPLMVSTDERRARRRRTVFVRIAAVFAVVLVAVVAWKLRS